MLVLQKPQGRGHEYRAGGQRAAIRGKDHMVVLSWCRSRSLGCDLVLCPLHPKCPPRPRLLLPFPHHSGSPTPTSPPVSPTSPASGPLHRLCLLPGGDSLPLHLRMAPSPASSGLSLNVPRTRLHLNDRYPWGGRPAQLVDHATLELGAASSSSVLGVAIT